MKTVPAGVGARDAGRTDPRECPREDRLVKGLLFAERDR